MSQSNNDCYFYYNSECSKGDFCPFRHEPAAIFQETVCSFWMQGKCTKINCSFRHSMDAINNHVKSEKNRSQIKCFWESQPTGCTKAPGHCPFMHGNRVVVNHDPYIPEAVVPASPLPGSIPGAVGKIIVNKNKLEEIAMSNPALANAANRTVLLPKRISVKHRLGKRMDENITDEHSGEIDSEEESLRRGAISTIDLRKRLSSKGQVAPKRRHSTSDEGSYVEAEEEVPKIRSVVKKVKKHVKEKKKKKEKRSKKEREKTKGSSRALRGEISPISKGNQDVSDIDVDSDTGDTLAQRIAAQRDRKRSKNANSDHSQKRSSPERSVEIVNKKEYLSPSPTSPLSLKTKKAKAARQASLSEADKDSVRSVIDDVDALLKSNDLNVPLSDSSSAKLHDTSHDVMKELDDLINS